MTNKRKQEILRQINKGLEWQFETYTWANMVNDCLLINDFTKKEIEWAKIHTGYKAYLC